MKGFKTWLLTLPIITFKNIFIYLLIINLLGFLAMFIDKKKAQKGRWRISEHALFMFDWLGGGIGTITGMYIFRHKTQKKKFTIGMPIILILEVIFLIYMIVI